MGRRETLSTGSISVKISSFKIGLLVVEEGCLGSSKERMMFYFLSSM